MVTRGAAFGFDSRLQITPSKVTSVRGNVIVTTDVLICFYRRGWVRGLHRLFTNSWSTSPDLEFCFRPDEIVER